MKIGEIMNNGYMNEVIDHFIEKNPSFNRAEAFRMNFCCKCGTEFSEGQKSHLFGWFDVVSGENGERAPAPSISCCGEV